MFIKPSTALRNEYNEIAELCKREDSPVFLTKNGEGDLVVMSVEHYTRREMMLDLREKLLRSEAERIAGCRSYSVDEVSTRLKELIDE
ncbi:type II toxin-antitoxin system prevent-host-death family antitoxin [Cloacibacillus porcorum]|jgi:prevent-host-death family protein|uniref:type II toxin-antitoxin system prevent-host-death family antitoxin n=1 Tax=Cloacibacillus porcorum TaxID=1197717 RepID=UPI001459ECC2|nr:type II toxin-antitoxin system prevent-host-death family antitoxin [Cloacibacillus porcorum]MCC8185784.1 type II toxin-antitoxin system Phd/YefM family antitoxin [Cloacibacillus porcorum]MCD7876440.1 type II toxin-antitoxin system Phd/YefM family antitoxin [Cloacibacillus porcorum]MCD8233265.1 type II toxin-antitoxin system Phd/YefM family antitoxin [Cloacibacillus porcorum]MDY5389925.1 type II toxin-antitoxin system prevent-host-death family antitoxin [Cloacibacillus porcorum]NMF17921.1 ty